MFIDMQCFPRRQMMPPIFDGTFPRPSIVQCTGAPPFMTKIDEIIKEVKGTIACFENQEGVSIVRNRNDIKHPIEGIKVILGLQQPPFDATREGLLELKELGVHLTTLSYKDQESPYGGGYLSEEAPLTTEGEKLLEMMSKVGIWLDCSHGGHETLRQAIPIANMRIPILATHTGSYEVYDNPRNLPDDILRSITNSGGIVGLYTLSFGLDPKDDFLDSFLKHLDHMVKVCGSGHVSIGTDGIYEKLTEEEAKAQYAKMKETVDSDGRMLSRYPVEAHELNLVRKDLILRARMSLAKMNTREIDGIMFENALRFLRYVL